MRCGLNCKVIFICGNLNLKLKLRLDLMLIYYLFIYKIAFCFDWALLIQFTRMFVNTIKHNKIDSSDEPLIIEDGNDTTVDDADNADNVYDNYVGRESGFEKKVDHFLLPPLFLVLAAVVHLIGSLAITAYPDKLLSYVITHKIFTRATN